MKSSHLAILVLLVLLLVYLFYKLPKKPETPIQNKQDSHQGIIDSLTSDTSTRAAAILSEMSPEKRADTINALAWFDQRMDDLILTRDARGVVTRLSGRSLAYDFAPAMPAVSLKSKADELFMTGKLGHLLLNLPAETQIQYQHLFYENAKESKFLYQQFYDGRRVRNATVAVTLDVQGRLRDIDSSLVGAFSETKEAAITQAQAVKIAIDDLKKRKAPFWLDVEPELDMVELVVVDLLPINGQVATANAFVIFLKTPKEFIGGYREVLVNESNGEVIASIEHTDLMLNDSDQILGASGRVGAGAEKTEEVLWKGMPEECPDNADPILGMTVLDRDINESKATMCEIVKFFTERGGEFASSDFRKWVDPLNLGLKVSVGAEPGLSIAANDRGTGITVYALGAARVEIIGHEFAHSLFRVYKDKDGNEVRTPSSFDGRSDGRSDADGPAMEEHLGDVFGMLLERRFTNRIEDRCLLGDDPDTLDTIGRTDECKVYTPCRGVRASWRSFCQPERANGGWCEGAKFHTDKGFKLYDIGYNSKRYEPYLGVGLSHTNLGIGNQVMSALLDDADARRYIDGWLIDGLGQTDSERLYLGGVVKLPEKGTWPGYAQAFIDAAITISGELSDLTIERNVRTAMASARIWSLPRLVSFESSASMANVTPTERPAVASLVLPDGRERTYLFFRQGNDSSDRGLYYAWRNEIPGGRFADTDTAMAGFTGPCRLGNAETLHSPTAAGRDGVLYVAWSQPTMEEGVGLLNGLRLPAENTASSGCDDEWDDYPPGFRAATGDGGISTVVRRLKGSPALALWQPKRKPAIINVGTEELIRCSSMPGLSVPAAYPINPLGQGFSFNACNLSLTPDFPPIPLPSDLVRRLEHLILPQLNSDPARAIPSVLDPMAPQRLLQDAPVHHQFSIDSLLRTDTKFATAFIESMTEASLIGSHGNEFAPSNITRIIDSFIPNPSAPSNSNYKFGARYSPDGPFEITFDHSEERLMLAFRDINDALRVVDYSDNRPTNRDGNPVIPLLAQGINPIDPALVSIPMERGHGYLTVVYGVRHNEHPTGFAYRTLLDTDSHGGFTAVRFLPQKRLDQFRGLVQNRRVRDYAYLRSLSTPVIAAGLRQLHMFTAELEETTPAAGAVIDDGYDPFPDVKIRQPSTSDHIRYTLLTMSQEGILIPESERPVTLTNSNLNVELEDSQAGAAQITQHRAQIRFFWPNGNELNLRSRPLH